MPRSAWLATCRRGCGGFALPGGAACTGALPMASFAARRLAQEKKEWRKVSAGCCGGQRIGTPCCLLGPPVRVLREVRADG